MTPLLVPLSAGPQVSFWLLMPIMIVGALGTVLAKRPVHSALSLAAVMLALAVQYAALQAPFLFAVQIIVYTGAILMLFLFVMMIVGVDTSESLIETIKGQRILALLATLGFFVLLVVAIGNGVTGSPAGLGQANGAEGGNVQGLAALVFGRYVIAFEATSALLITAALAAMVLTHRERLRKKETQAELAVARIEQYGQTGAHPGALPSPGFYARHNSVDTPALQATGEISQASVSSTLKARGVIQNAEDLLAPTQRTVAAIAPERAENPATAVARFSTRQAVADHPNQPGAIQPGESRSETAHDPPSEPITGSPDQTTPVHPGRQDAGSAEPGPRQDPDAGDRIAPRHAGDEVAERGDDDENDGDENDGDEGDGSGESGGSGPSDAAPERGEDS